MKVVVRIEIELDPDMSGGEVKLGFESDPPVNPNAPMPIDALIVATEHMMTWCALESAAGFDKALDLLVEGAKSNKVKEFGGHKVQ